MGRSQQIKPLKYFFIELCELKYLLHIQIEPEVKTRLNGNYTIGIACQNFSSTFRKQEIPDWYGEMGYFNSWSY